MNTRNLHRVISNCLQLFTNDKQQQQYGNGVHCKCCISIIKCNALFYSWKTIFPFFLTREREKIACIKIESKFLFYFVLNLVINLKWVYFFVCFQYKILILIRLLQAGNNFTKYFVVYWFHFRTQDIFKGFFLAIFVLSKLCCCVRDFFCCCCYPHINQA